MSASGGSGGGGAEGSPAATKGKSPSHRETTTVVHRMEGYFDKLKSKKGLGSGFNKRYFAVVRTPDNRFFLNYYGKRSDLTDDSKPSGSIPLAEIDFVGVPGQKVEDRGRPDFKVGDPSKTKKKESLTNLNSTPGTPAGGEGEGGGGGILAHDGTMEKHAARGLQIGSKHQNMFIVGDNSSMAHKWIAGLCFMRDLPLPPGIGWPKKFGAPPPCLFKSSKDGEVTDAPSELPRVVQGFLNSVVVEKGG
jgi:hypothetical protein